MTVELENNHEEHETIESINLEIVRLQQRAEELRQFKRKEKLMQARQIIKDFHLTIQDLFDDDAQPIQPKRVRNHATDRRLGKAPIKYRDEHGNTWSGRGRQPKWVSNYQEQGRDIEEFLVKEKEDSNANVST